MKTRHHAPSRRFNSHRVSLCAEIVLAELLVVIVLMDTALAQPIPSGVSPGSGGIRAFSNEVRRTVGLLKLPGLSLAVVQDGKIVYRQNEGFADLERKTPIADDHIFWLSSITKTFSAVMMMQYAREGRLSLDDAVIQYPFTSVGFVPQRVHEGVRLKHVLSHTSESVPGEAFVYHGGRYNFIYGVFERMSGKKFPMAFHQELAERILRPLQMEATLAGFAGTNRSVLRERMVTPYLFNADKQTFEVQRNNGALNRDAAFPSTGLLSSIADLAAYTTALDENRLLTRASYDKMTAPFIDNAGRPTPYGTGWFTEMFAGIRLHWAYGWGESDSSLLLRVPDRKLSLIVLCNSSLLSAAAPLGGGNVLHSPLGAAFLKHFVLPRESPVATVNYDESVGQIRAALKASLSKESAPFRREELFSQALLVSFAENTFRLPAGNGAGLTELLYELHPEAFTRNDPAAFHLLARFSDPTLDPAAKLALESYERSGRFHPGILHSIALRHEARGDRSGALKYLHRLADTPGFEEQGDKIDACSRLATYYAAENETDLARKYAWRALIYTRQAGYDDSGIQQQIARLSSSAAARE